MSLRRRGLSLIEILIVVTLIAVMMALSLPMLSSANAKARSELCQQNLVEMGQTIAGYAVENDTLPTLYLLEPTEAGQSLSEFIKPRLHTPHVVFCPSDETDESRVLGTSYRWSNAFNRLPPEQWASMLGQPMLADRENFHLVSGLPANELVVASDEAGLHLSVPAKDKANKGRNKVRLKGKKKRKPKPDHRPDHAGLSRSIQH